MRAILFDVDDTLYDQIEPFRNAHDGVFGERFTVNMEELFQARHRRSDEVFGRSLAGEMSMQEMYVYRTQKAYEDMGVQISDEEALQFQKIYKSGQDMISLSPELQALLEELSGSGIATGIITNGPSEHQWNKIHTLGLTRWIPENHIFVSADCPCAKPDPGIFRYALKKMKLMPEDVWYVGDSYCNDVVSARKAGWNVIWLNRREVDIEGCTVRPDCVVKSEGELCECIRNIIKCAAGSSGSTF